MQFKFIFSLILAIIVSIFAIQNSEAVPVNFIIYNLEISQALIILISVIVGATIAFSLGLIKQFSMNKLVKDKDKLIKNLEMSVARLEVENKEIKTSTASINTEITQCAPIQDDGLIKETLY